MMGQPAREHAGRSCLSSARCSVATTDEPSEQTLIGFLLWGLSIGQQYQDLYARGWRIHVGTTADQAIFTIWFFVASALVALMTVLASELRSNGWLVALPAWIAGSMGFMVCAVFGRSGPNGVRARTTGWCSRQLAFRLSSWWSELFSTGAETTSVARR
jgi:hypothetical protein